MASITIALVLVAGCGCSGGGDDHPPGTDPSPSHSGLVADTAPEVGTGDTSDTGPAAHTGQTTETGPAPGPGCGSLPPAACVHLTGNEEADFAGRWVDVGDVDGDGLAEVLVSESADAWVTYGHTSRASVHVLKRPAASGVLADEAWLRIDGPPPSTFPSWGDPAGLLSTASQVVLSDTSVADYNVRAFDLPAAGGIFRQGDDVGTLFIPPPYNQLGFPSKLLDCQTSDGTPALCATSINTNTDLVGDNAGQVFVFDAPLVGDVFVLDARARFLGDPVDGARVANGDADLDGDGLRDLVVGAFYRGGTGAVAVLLAPPDGVHRLWDVADATLTGVVSGGELGLGLSTGDLDGDGTADVLAGAPIAASAAAYVARGPHAGERSVAQAEWSVVDADGDWLGYDLAVGDFDGDGAPDLAVGAPRSVSGGTEPGEVLVFLAPPPGTYTPADASATLLSGVGLPDAFGLSLDVGDLDGDGRSDLVVGAPRDPTAGDSAGSATVLYGAGL